MADYVASTTNIWPYYSVGNKATDNAGKDNVLGKDQFLQILMAQIKNQDPMQPLEDKEFIAQMAQFTSVEQLMNMAKSLEGLTNSIGFTSSLIGKTVGWEVASSGSEVPVAMTGVVDSILLRDGIAYAIVEDWEVPVGSIVYVSNHAAAGGEPDNGPDSEGDSQGDEGV